MKAYVLSTERRPPPLASKWRRFVDRYLPSVVIYLMVATLVAVVLYPHVVVTVPSGQVGVWKRFGGGTVLDPRRLRDEGLHVIWPWDELFLYDLRLQSITETYSAISSDGVSLSATMNVRFRAFFACDGGVAVRGAGHTAITESGNLQLVIAIESPVEG
jgi:hypothetical protein